MEPHGHIYLGFRKGKRQRKEECFNCGATPSHGAYTYFGGFLCAECWDSYWRKTEDGKTDPPYADFQNTSSGYSV
jgi:recombinational DNA repair protein (RecF pathway)